MSVSLRSKSSHGISERGKIIYLLETLAKSGHPFSCLWQVLPSSLLSQKMATIWLLLTDLWGRLSSKRRRREIENDYAYNVCCSNTKTLQTLQRAFSGKSRVGLTNSDFLLCWKLTMCACCDCGRTDFWLLLAPWEMVLCGKISLAGLSNSRGIILVLA